MQKAQEIDHLDAQIIIEMVRDPRVGVMELARRLGIARGTAQARLTRLLDSGIIRPSVELDFTALGYPVTGFSTLEISQGSIREVVGPLESIPEVIEVHTVAGSGDVLVRVAAASNNDLFRIIEEALQSPAVLRTSTAIALVEHVPRRVDPFANLLDTEL